MSDFSFDSRSCSHEKAWEHDLRGLLFFRIVGRFGNFHGHENDGVFGILGAGDAAGAFRSGEHIMQRSGLKMSEYVHEAARGEGDDFQIPLE